MQQMVWSGTTDSKNTMSSSSSSSSSLMPCAEEQAGASMLLPQQLLQMPWSRTGLLAPPELNGGAASSLLATDLHDVQAESSTPESWSQLLIKLCSGGLVEDHDEGYNNAATALLSKGLEEQLAAPAYNFYGGGDKEMQTQAVSRMLLPSSSPRSCVTNMLDFSNSTALAPELKNRQSDNSSESNSNATCSAPKKARVQTSSSAQSTLKVRKERLGDRITALHQIVSPFGKTDTASVLQETIGYIRFLLSQIEALSYPYLGVAGNGDSMMLQHHHQTLLNHSTPPGGSGTADAEGQADEQREEDLRSRGLCLVPVSCTSHLAAVRWHHLPIG